MTLKQIREDERVYELNRVYGEDFKYEVNLNDGWRFDDESHYAVFDTVKEIENALKNEVEREVITMEREMTIDSLEEMCDLMCGGIEDMEKRYLVKDLRLVSSEQDTKEYTLEELKEGFKMDLQQVNEKDKEFFKVYNDKIDACVDIDDLNCVVSEHDLYCKFVEVNND